MGNVSVTCTFHLQITERIFIKSDVLEVYTNSLLWLCDPIVLHETQTKY